MGFAFFIEKYSIWQNHLPERESMQFSPLHERYLVSLQTHEREAPERPRFVEFVVLQPYDSGGPLAWG